MYDYVIHTGIAIVLIGFGFLLGRQTTDTPRVIKVKNKDTVSAFPEDGDIFRDAMDTETDGRIPTA